MKNQKRKATRKASQRVQSQPSFIAVDFFCGAGGTTRGLIDAGGYVLAGVDKDDRCATTYVHNNANKTLDRAKSQFLHFDIFPKSSRYLQGQQQELIAELKTQLSVFRKRHKSVPLLFAICAPCQPFTTVSKKKLSDRRKAGRSKDKNLLREALKFVKHFKPELVLSENVQGIGDARYGGVWKTFQNGLKKLGYATGTKVVCSSRFGIPQFRKRSILLAARNKYVRAERFADRKTKQLLVPAQDPNSVMVSVKQAIGHFPAIKAGALHPSIPNHRARFLEEINVLRLRHAKPGQTNKYMQDINGVDMSLKCHRKVNAKLKVRCFNDVYTRMLADQPSPTITTKCHSISNGRFGHFDVKQIRAITPREAAALQSFPDSYVFFPVERLEPVSRMIGNAVPPKLARFFSEYLVRSIELPSLAGARSRG